MYREQIIRCLDCNDEFKVSYDSHKEKQEHVKCKCGKVEASLNSYGSISYSKDTKIERIGTEKYEYYDDDYIKLTEEEQLLYDEIDEIGHKINSEYIYDYTDFKWKSCIYLSVSGCNSQNEVLEIKLDIKLQSNSGWKDYELEEKHKRILEGLTRFLDIVKRAYNKELDLNDPRNIWKNEELCFHDSYKTQQKLYDYELYC